MAYDADALLRLRVIEQGLDKLITDLGIVQREVGGSDKGLDALERTMVRAQGSASRLAGTEADVAAGARAVATSMASADKATQQASRSYLNTSTAMDAAIRERTATSKTFSTQLRAQMQAEVDEENAARRSANTHLQSLSTTRTSLYDASRSLAAFGVATLALPVASAAVAAAYQSDFATVERSLVGSKYNADQLKQSFIDLSTEIPLSFKQITGIASAGAQLGIGAKDLPSFTKTVAELTATTNLSADAAENLLGKFHTIAGVGSADFDNLASSVLNVGVHTSSTEQQIAKTATQIVGIGAQAGFTTPQIIGLAGALASVSTTGAELSRGTVTRFVTDMQRAVLSGGPALKAFADTANVSTAEVQKAFGTDKFAGVFQKFIMGLDAVRTNGGNAVGVLNAIGISSVRDVPLLLNLAKGYVTLNQSMEYANQGYQDQSLLTQHFDKINSTLISHVKELGGAFGALFNDLGASSTGPLNALVTGFTGVIKSIDEFAKTDPGKWILGITLAVAAFLGAAALAGGALAKVAAGAIAIGQAYRGVTAFLDTYTASRAAATAATADETAATVANTVANDANAASLSASSRAMGGLVSVGKLAGLATLIGAAGAAAGGLNDALDHAVEKANGFNTDTLQGKIDLVTSKKTGLINPSTGGAESALSQEFLYGSVQAERSSANLNIFGTATAQSKAIKDLDESLASLAAKGPASFNALGAAMSEVFTKTGVPLSQLKIAFPALTGEMDKMGIKMRDLGGSVEFYATKSASAETQAKAMNLTFQAMSGMDPKAVTKMAQGYAASVQPLTDFNTVMGSIQQQLKDADSNYDGVTVSVDQFTKQMNDNNAAQTTWFGNLTALNQQVVAQTGDQGTADSITNQLLAAGYSVTNASFLQQLVNAAPAQRQAYINAMTQSTDAAASAAGNALISAGHLVTSSGAAIGSDTAQQIGQELLAGFSPADIMKQFNLTFGQNPATPTADPAPATNTLQSIVDNFNGKTIHFDTEADTGGAQGSLSAFISANANHHIIVYVDTVGRTQNYATPTGGFIPSGYTGGFFNGSKVIARAGGGPIFGPGSGTSDQVPAWLSNGEYVIRAQAVSSLGIDYLNAINRSGAAALHRAQGGAVSSAHGFSAAPRFSSGGPVTATLGDGVMPVELSPYDRSLLEYIGNNIGLEISGTALQKATSAAAVNSSRRGSL